MNLDQAYKILDYVAVPQQRAEQLGLIKIMGYKKVNGVKSLSRSPDYQLRQVAQQLFRDAEKKVRQYWKEAEEEENQEQYHAHLCEIFNIPESEREETAIHGLEEQLLQ